ncbi:MAG TPA: type II toxin-antitoxin system HicA family toxin [Thermodesulforhabdus norvegica]|uniref:Type II toxin-antitoxin system HicA family toxin n=1 Tax=Thermodesulforhabdus norvegica TaxID=39841 RepID=A0A7C0WU22_9BACT|nr:type II toxin-antitoxin system HicA family toxin [Thermodesulforhabdus norvegica]
MKGKHRKTVTAIFSDPVNGNMEWSRIEALFIALCCQVIEGDGSSVTFEKDGIRAYFHRPHPDREALRYRIKDAREFLKKLGVRP